MFIIFEGLDGSGKSTQANMLATWLKEQSGKKVLLTREPTNNIIGGLIRGQLTGDWKTDMKCLQLLYSADRAHHLEREIEPALAKGEIVISDRYYFSSLAYGSLEVDMEWLREVNSQFRKPDYVFYLDIDADTCIARMKKDRYELELFETKKKLAIVAKNYYKSMKGLNNVFRLKGSEKPEEIFDKIKKIIKLQP